MDSPRHRSKSPQSSSSPKPPSQEAPAGKTPEQLVEEREKRRERLLAGRDARLSKIVSSVGGTSFTPPSAIVSPATAAAATAANVKNRHVGGTAAINHPTGHATESVNVREKREELGGGSMASTIPTTTPIGGPICPSSDRKHTLLILLITLGFLVSAWYYLGGDCFKTVLGGGRLYGECGERLDVARKAYYGLLLAALLPILLEHGRRGDYLLAIRSSITGICLSLTILIFTGYFIDRM